MPDTSITFPVEPYNNLQADSYEPEVYEQAKVFGYVAYGVMGLALGEFLIGLAIGRFIGVEMIGVVQVGFIGLTIVSNMQPLMSKLLNLKFVNGVNTYFIDQHETMLVTGEVASGLVPFRISSLDYES